MSVTLSDVSNRYRTGEKDMAAAGRRQASVIHRVPPGLIALFILLTLAAIQVIMNTSGTSPSTAADYTREVVRVQMVFDGDTFSCPDGRRVRLLGVDAPEVSHPDQLPEPFSEESTDWLRKRIQQTDVTLEIGRPTTDRYHRTLAWVYDSEGVLVNRELLRAGAARLLPDFGLPLELEPSLRAAEAEARVAGRGLWRRRTKQESPH